MYWGSVRFYKHLILTVIRLLIVTPSVTSFVLLFKYIDIKNENAECMSAVEFSNMFNDRYHENIDLPQLEDPSFSYQQKYEDMYVQRGESTGESTPSDKPVVYLTFDDGPSAQTEILLDILKENDVKATFFVVYKEGEYAKKIYQRIVREGHTLGIHSTSHDYKKIYQSVEDYLDDFATLYYYLYEVTGTRPEVFRFPGGSINAYNQSIYMEIIAEMLRRGFVYYDWNVASGDRSSVVLPAATIESNVVSAVKSAKEYVVLMHDSAYKSTTVQAVKNMLPYLKENTYLRAITPDVEPVIFTYLK